MAHNESLELRIGYTDQDSFYTDFATIAFTTAQAVSGQIFEIDAEFRVNAPLNAVNQSFTCYIKFEYLDGTTQKTFKLINQFQLNTTKDQSLSVDVRSAELSPALNQNMQTQIQTINKLF